MKYLALLCLLFLSWPAWAEEAPACAEYQPGVDVHGNQVMPADLANGTEVTIDKDVLNTKEITVPIIVDLSKNTDLDGAEMLEMGHPIGEVKINTGERPADYIPPACPPEKTTQTDPKDDDSKPESIIE